MSRSGFAHKMVAVCSRGRDRRIDSAALGVASQVKSSQVKSVQVGASA